jgi:hypothetical protein
MLINSYTSLLQRHRRPLSGTLFLTGTRRAGAGLAVALVALAGCSSEDCIDMGCGPPYVEVQFEPVITQAGHYRIDVVADGVASGCEFDFHPDERWSGASACASALLGGGVSRDQATEVAGYGLPQAAEVSISVFRDGQLWAEHTFEPVYRPVELFGDGCGTCSVAKEVVQLP